MITFHTLLNRKFISSNLASNASVVHLRKHYQYIFYLPWPLKQHKLDYTFAWMVFGIQCILNESCQKMIEWMENVIKCNAVIEFGGKMLIKMIYWSE